jgi:PAS domain S-box-containing protein
MSFNIKLFLTFIIFGVFLSLFSLYSFSKITDERLLLNKKANIEDLLIKKEIQISTVISNLDKQLKLISTNASFQEFVKDGSNREYVNGLFEAIINSEHGIVQIKYLNNQEEVLVLHENNDKIFENSVKEKELNSYFYREIKKQNIGNLWHSKMGANMDNISNLGIIEPLLVLGINLEYGVLEFKLSLEEITRSLKHDHYNFYLVDKEGNIIIDADEKLSWSYYLNKNIDLKEILHEFTDNFLVSKFQKTDNYVSIKLSLDNEDDAILILLYPDFETIITKEMYYVYITILLSTIVVAIILAYFFSMPMSTMTNKIEKLNRRLDKKVEKRTSQLNDSLRIIDKYVIRSVTDLSGVIIDASEAFCKISHYTREELIGKTHSIVRHPDMSSEVFASMWQTIKSGKNWNGKVKNLAQDGSYYWVDAYVEPNFENGKIVSYTAIRNDITDKILLEELNESLNEKIKEEVEKSTKQLELIQKEQINSVKLRSIGALAAGITHEINTPLTYIKGNFELIQCDMDDLPASEIRDRMLEDSVVIIEGINRISNIIEAMREVSQVSSEIKEKVNIYSTLITALIISNNRSKQVSKIYLNDKLVHIDLDKNEFQYIAKVQKQRIEQAWIIIINNALDELFKKENYEDRRLDINIKSDNGKIIVEFIDNAGGIDKSIIDKLFEPFVSNKKSGGIGLGLNIAKNIVDEQHGKIVAKNINDGAMFRIELSFEG